MPDLDQLALTAPHDAAVTDQLLRLVRAHAIKVCRRRLAWHPHLVDDAVQETVIATWSVVPRWRPERPFLAVVSRIAVNKCVSALRAQRPSMSLDGLGFEDLAADVPDPAEVAASTDMYSRVQAAMARLSTTDQQVLTLRFLYGMPGADIAHVLGVPHGHVRKRQHSALRKVAARV
ncbi:sigma-70 family RNA polymerase sigma factor [Sphaerisporangium album]|uniref:Sigma-70 family RNA polymerase sigma factor n=1 Tax=Sphaerisporangium album TaxID=509200 RepID=A0A367FAC4_9ACTN|nr:sigma-70 family RNA polymerase sigma factor [Sphaerisporangium album]RCG27211.1 sigma-70 family RNA polymerase sigma factor [Sphaerisporangium album]